MAILSNPRHERFAQELASGKPASEAYELAGYKPNRGNATTLKQEQSILDRVNEILAEREKLHGQSTAEAIQRAALTKEWVIDRLVENVDRAMQAEEVKDSQGRLTGEYRYDGSVANRALELLGKELGMFIDRKEVRTGTLDGATPDELERLREELIAERARRAGAGDHTETQGKPH